MRFSKSLKRSARFVRKRSFKNFDAENFKWAVKQLSWWDLYMCQDVDQAAMILTTKLNNILDSMAPVKTVQVHTTLDMHHGSVRKPRK